MENKQETSQGQATPVETGMQSQASGKPPKGLLIFVVVAVILSLVTTLYILFKPSSLPKMQPIASPVTVPPLTLELLSPADGELAVNREILVSGKTLPDTPVVIFTETDETSLDSDSAGMFETTITLDDGINTLIVTAYGQDGEEQTKSIDIVYDPES